MNIVKSRIESNKERVNLDNVVSYKQHIYGMSLDRLIYKIVFKTVNQREIEWTYMTEAEMIVELDFLDLNAASV